MRGLDWQPIIYILAKHRRGALYVGVTSDLESRIHEHLTGQVVHTQQYDIKRLAWFRAFERIDEAIGEEKRIKRWRRSWKIDLIEAENRTGATCRSISACCLWYPIPSMGSGSRPGRR